MEEFFWCAVGAIVIALFIILGDDGDHGED